MVAASLGGGASAAESAFDAARFLPPPLPRTGRHCLVALGTLRDYTVPGARYDLVIVSPERPLRGALERARGAYPGARVLGYLNTMDVFAGELDRELSRNESWFLHDAKGERIRVRVTKYQGNRARFGMNVGAQGYQDWLAGRGIQILKSGYDGLQLDNVETDSSYHERHVGTWISQVPVELDHRRWPEAQRSMLARIRARLDEAGYRDRAVVINHIRSGEPEVSRLYVGEVEGANCEGWIIRDRPIDGPFGWRARIDQAAETSRAGKILNLLTLTRSMSAEESIYMYASYLLAKEGEGLLFFYGTSLRPQGTRWFDHYDLDLGRAAGPMEGVDGAFQRRYEKGFVVVNPYDRPATLAPPAGAVDAAHEPVRSLTLQPRHAAILELLPGGASPGRTSLEAEAGSSSGDGTVVDRPEASGGRVVRFGGTGDTVTFETALAEGRWRLVIDGFPEGRQADACFVEAEGVRRRIYFAPGHRPTVEIRASGGRTKIRVEAAEPGVAIDRIVLVKLGGAGPK